MAATDDVPEGYPDSPADETTPDQPALSLEVADREAEGEDEVNPEGAAPAGDTADEDRFADSPDVDQLAAIELGNRGSRPEDAANFEDNAADWSRERS